MTSSAEILVVARAATPPLAMVSGMCETCPTCELCGLHVARLPSADQRHDRSVLIFPHHCSADATLAALRCWTIS